MNEKNMKLYKYKGVPYSTKKKKIFKGYILAQNEIEAKNMLKNKKNLSITYIKETSKFVIKMTSVNGKDVALFFEGLSTMIKAGISVNMSLDNIINGQRNLKMIYFIYQLKAYIEEGKSLPDAMALTNFFPTDVIEMVRVGDSSGKITQVLDNLVTYYNQKAAIKKAIVSAVSYPIIVIIVAFLILLYLAPKMIEPMIGLFAGFKNVEFPTLTLIVLGFVKFIKANMVIILVSLFGSLFALIHQYRNNKKFTRFIDSLLVKMPITGEFITRLSNYKFVMSLEILYNAGIPIDKAMLMVERSERNMIVKESYREIIDYIAKGGNFYTAVNDSEFMNDMGKSLIEIGERTGSLDKILKNLSNIMREEFDLFTKKLNKMMAPISTLVIGGIIGTIIIAVYLPIISMMDIAKNAG